MCYSSCERPPAAKSGVLCPPDAPAYAVLPYVTLSQPPRYGVAHVTPWLPSLKEPPEIVEVRPVMDRTHRAAAPHGSRHQDQRWYVVAASLADLHGPTRGVVRLERALDWSADPHYDLDDPGDLAVLYQTVLNRPAAPHSCTAGSTPTPCAGSGRPCGYPRGCGRPGRRSSPS